MSLCLAENVTANVTYNIKNSRSSNLKKCAMCQEHVYTPFAGVSRQSSSLQDGLGQRFVLHGSC